MKKLLIVLLVVALAAFLLVGCIPVTPGEGEGKVIVARGQAPVAPVDLGSAGSFVILTKSGISTTGTTSITGDIGVSPYAATSITGFDLTMDGSGTFSTSALVIGKVYAADYAPPTPTNLGIAVLDIGAAYTDAAGRTNPTATELGDGNIGGMTLAPGLYKWSTGVTIPTDVTLSGGKNAVWIFQIAGTLDISSATSVILRGAAQAKNIFWQVAGVVTLGTTSEFKGNILAKTNIAMNTDATLNGRALAQTAVTLIANTIYTIVKPTPGAADTTPPIDLRDLHAKLSQKGETEGWDLHVWANITNTSSQTFPGNKMRIKSYQESTGIAKYYSSATGYVDISITPGKGRYPSVVDYWLLDNVGEGKGKPKDVFVEIWIFDTIGNQVAYASRIAN